MTKGTILNQLRAWRARWRVDPPEDAEEKERILCRSIAVALSSPDGKVMLDYLIDTYYRPLQFIGPSDGGRSLERNGSMIVIVDILEKYDRGMHPAAFEPERGSQDEKEVDVRMMKT